ncbi:MAG TPA: response regulator [Bacteroidia bacterium]|jgi:CheY-like chemotaxis protein|nr:response regulator [Bacteroidia bacterium]
MKKINCILLVDDNPADNEFHKIIINDSNVCNQVKIATNGKNALDYIIKSGNQGTEDTPKPDLIFLDINMPGMNGFEFLEEYHKLDEKLKSKIVIVMLSTSLNPDDSERAQKNEEVTEFMNKPLMVETLKKMIEKYF